MALNLIPLSNNFFAFKKFKVFQDKVAMKVSTDACIQGAFAAKIWKEKTPKTILDIGSGTGLLSLMIAQQLSEPAITAIDIEENAINQSQENFNISPWKDRLQTSLSALQDLQIDKPFDAIICNPPFFHKHLGSKETARHVARHDDSLSKKDLFRHTHLLLSTTGSLCTLYPQNEWQSALKTATEEGFNLYHQINIQPNRNKNPNRVIAFFSKESPNAIHEKDFTIYDYPSKNYTLEFQTLLSDYYLHL